MTDWAIRRALNIIAGTADLGEQAAANAAIGRVNRVDRAAFSAMPTNALGETYPRVLPAGAAIGTTSGALFLTAIHLVKDDVISSITYMSDSTAANGPTHQWFALYSSARVLLKQTPDDTNVAWGANATKTLSFASSYTVPSTGMYYVGVMVTTTVTQPTFENVRMATNLSGLAPIVSGQSTTGLTTTAPDPAGAITASTVGFYAYVS